MAGGFEVAAEPCCLVEEGLLVRRLPVANERRGESVSCDAARGIFGRGDVLVATAFLADS